MSVSSVVVSDNWGNLISPSSMEMKDIGPNKSCVILQPFEPGFANTMAVSLRRVMMSYITGAAISAIKIDSVFHEYSSIDGVKEDVVDIILNLKNVVFAIKDYSAKKDVVKLCVDQPGPVTAGMILGSDLFEVVNKDLLICHVADGGVLNMEITITVGCGYVPASKKKETSESFNNLIFIDSIYSPIKHVSHRVESSRVGQFTNYDKLVLDIETDGSIPGDKAVAIAARILREQLDPFINFKEFNIQKKTLSSEKAEFNSILFHKVDELDLSVRSFNCFKNANIIYIGDLVSKEESEMLHMPNFGRKSLNEIKAALAARDLSFGMKIPGWPPKNIEELTKKYNCDD